MLKHMKHIRILFVHLGTPQVTTAAVLRLRTIVDDSWTVNAATLQHIPRENDATLQEALRQANIIICMGKSTFDELEKRFQFDARKMLTWHEDRYTSVSIDRYCQELASYLNEGSWIDVIDKDGNDTGICLPVSWVCDRGYWHRSIHVVLMTRGGGAVLELRSKGIFSNPGTVDITLGGFVDCKETPERAALRELKEELGLRLSPEKLDLIDVRARSAWHPRHRKLSRSITYAYMAVIDENDVVFRPEFSEVAGIALCTRSHLNDLLRGKSIRGLGRIHSSMAYYNDVVRLARRHMKKQHPSSLKRKKNVQ